METSKKLNVGAILVGLGTDIGCTILTSMVLALALAARAGMCPYHAGAASDLLALGFVSSFFCTVLGGFVTGWLAREQPLRHALWMGLLSTSLGALMVAGQHGDPGPFLTTPLALALSFAAVTPLALLGGWLSRALSR